jgi:hypothetical protein
MRRPRSSGRCGGPDRGRSRGCSLVFLPFRFAAEKIVHITEKFDFPFEKPTLSNQVKLDDGALIALTVAKALFCNPDDGLHQFNISIVDVNRHIVMQTADHIATTRSRLAEVLFGEGGHLYHVIAVVLNTSASKVVEFIDPIHGHISATNKVRSF